MKANQIKTKGWIDCTKPSHKKQSKEYYELRGREINKCFGKVTENIKFKRDEENIIWEQAE